MDKPKKKFSPPAHIFGPAVQKHLIPEIMKLPKPEEKKEKDALEKSAI